MSWVQINIQVNEEGLNFFQVLFKTTCKALHHVMLLTRFIHAARFIPTLQVEVIILCDGFTV